MIRVAAPHQLLDPKKGPLIAVRLHIVSRKTLGGLQTDLDGRVLDLTGNPIPGLYAAGEVAGFGGGGVHGYRSLEGTFLGGCIFSGRQAGRACANYTLMNCTRYKGGYVDETNYWYIRQMWRKMINTS